MQRGQLGTGIQRRIIFVWEGAVAELPDHRAVRAMEYAKRRMRLWDAALNYWVLNEDALKTMWSLLARTDMRIDMVVTTRPAGFARALAQRCERENWPVRYVFAQEAAHLGRLLPTMADVDRVYYGLVEQRWCYGPHGVFFSPSIGQIA